jgi:hypothetical protein
MLIREALVLGHDLPEGAIIDSNEWDGFDIFMPDEANRTVRISRDDNVVRIDVFDSRLVLQSTATFTWAAPQIIAACAAAFLNEEV